MDNSKYLQAIPIATPEYFACIRQIIKEELQTILKSQPEEALISPAQACLMFQPKISKPTLASWTSDGRIPVHRIGRRLYYKKSELIEAAKTLKKYKPLSNFQ